MPETKIVGALQEHVEGPATIIHEGGDPILIAELEGGLPGGEVTLTYNGAETVIDGDDEFVPADEADRSHKISGGAVIRALGQANYSISEKAVSAERDISVAAQKLADELGVDLDDIEGDGKITVPDVKALAQVAV